MHVTAKFHRPTFNRSEVIVLRNRQIDKQTKQTDAAENIHLAPLCYMPVGKYSAAELFSEPSNLIVQAVYLQHEYARRSSDG